MQYSEIAAQIEHERRQREDPNHDDCGCWCCCISCEDMQAEREELRKELANGNQPGKE